MNSLSFSIVGIYKKFKYSLNFKKGLDHGLISGQCYMVINICLTSLTRAKCDTRSTLFWKILNISDSTELFAL